MGASSLCWKPSVKISAVRSLAAWRRPWRLALYALLAVLLLGALLLGLFWQRSLPQREGSLPLSGLRAPVAVRFDAEGVPHIQAEHETDLYRALGFVHAQDRLFQMELLRRLAQGELAEILGAELLPVDRLFRTLRLGEQASAAAAREPHDTPAWRALQAYLDGINQFQASRPLPPEFAVLGITPRPFTATDTFSVVGYMAYSFAAALRSEPLLTHVRDRLGSEYLAIFSEALNRAPAASGRLQEADWSALEALAQQVAALPGPAFSRFAGSNAWALSGARTASGAPQLAGDPHIAFSVPQVWYSARLEAPGLDLYGEHHALVPFALLGHSAAFAWSLTMLQNDDMDLIAEQVDPQDAQRIWHDGQWVTLSQRCESIAVRDAAPVELCLRRSPNGPLINEALGEQAGPTPLALRWVLYEAYNPILDAFYQLNRADSLAKARAAVAGIAAPGLNVVWAGAGGDIAWWSAARLLRHPPGVDPAFILQGGSADAQAPQPRPFAENPQEENPPRGYVLSANQRPAGGGPGYYNPVDRQQRLQAALDARPHGWTPADSRALQLDTASAYPARLLAPLAAELRAEVGEAERALLEELLAWSGAHELDSRPAVLFNQLRYELARAALADELGEGWFAALLQTRALDEALPALAARHDSPWWDDRATPAREDRAAILARAWQASLAHLRALYGAPDTWRWGRAHTLTFGHPLGRLAPLDRLLNVGPLEAPGSHEVPNNLSQALGPAPWPVQYGPSVRRVIELGAAPTAWRAAPLGQSGVPLDRHYADQARAYLAGEYRERPWAAQPDGRVLWLRP